MVEFLMALFISIFAALATGGGIVAGQYLGDRDSKNANKAVNQLVKFTLYFSLMITILIFVIKPFILSHLFGTITPEVHSQADRYFNIVALSTPFIALYNSGAAIFRTLNKSRFPMNIMLVMNGLNILMGISLIYGLGWGVEGVAVPILFSRVGAMILVPWFAYHLTSELTLGNFLKEKVDWKMIKKVLSAEYYKRKVSRIIHITNACLSAAVIALMPLLMKLYNLSAVFRSAGDTNFPMVISISSMLLVRVVCAYFFLLTLEWGC